MQIIQAARLMEAAYRGPSAFSDVVDVLDHKGVQAVLLPDRTIVVQGTNEASDWWTFNLKVGLRRPRIAELRGRRGASGAVWHSGFLRHAEILYEWAKPHRPRMLIGHSLGAAAVQIVGASLMVPAIAFAAPRTKKTKALFAGESKVLNICRTDDTVVGVPPGFRRLGNVTFLKPRRVNPGMDHQMAHYITLLRDPQASRQVPAHWPQR